VHEACFKRLSFEPGLLIKPADGSHDCQEEQTEHEIGLRAQPLVQKMAEVEEQERCEDNGESQALSIRMCPYW